MTTVQWVSLVCFHMYLKNGKHLANYGCGICGIWTKSSMKVQQLKFIQEAFVGPLQ